LTIFIFLISCRLPNVFVSNKFEDAVGITTFDCDSSVFINFSEVRSDLLVKKREDSRFVETVVK
jgi:hypothetical protein